MLQSRGTISRLRPLRLTGCTLPHAMFTAISLLFLLRIQIRACGDRIDVQRRALALQLNLFILVFMCLSFVENTVTTMYWKGILRLAEFVCTKAQRTDLSGEDECALLVLSHFGALTR
ncbi:MAG: hypothetical protein ACLTW9_03860 [Enterocloster sp.]